MADLIVIGTGPAGITAAVYAARAGLKVAAIAKDGGALARADKIENYYGFSAPISGEELLNNGIEQAKRLGVEIICDEVTGLTYDGAFIVKAKRGEYTAKSVVLATGAVRSTPNIKNLTEFIGSGVSYCAICDGFFFRGKKVAVLGGGEYALAEARELLPLAREVVLLTDGEDSDALFPAETTVIAKKVAALEGETRLERVVFDDGTTLDTEGLFIAKGSAGSAELARKLGAATEGNTAVTDDARSTGIAGLFAAGDCTAGLKQIAKAVCDGAIAGTQAAAFLRKKA